MYKILIVEDEDELRNGLSNYFPWDEIGFEIAGYSKNGKQALEFIQKNNIDIVLSDIRMPIMSGIELAKEIHQKNLNIKIIFYSGYRDFDYAQKAIEYGVSNFIVKSTKYSKLIEVFKKVREELNKEKLSGKRIVPLESINAVPNDSKNHNKIIDLIKIYTCQHYKDITLKNVAQEIHMNADYASRYFKQRTGQKFSNYVISVKMEKAAELISQSLYKTYEISEMVGYSNPKNFSRAFKNYYNKSPREYKNSDSK